MCDHAIKWSHITLWQENIFSFYSELGHFQSPVAPKNLEFSERLVLTPRISKFRKIEKQLYMTIHEIKCLQQVIFDCTNAKICNIYASKPI